MDELTEYKEYLKLSAFNLCDTINRTMYSEQIISIEKFLKESPLLWDDDFKLLFLESLKGEYINLVGSGFVNLENKKFIFEQICNWITNEIINTKKLNVSGVNSEMITDEDKTKPEKFINFIDCFLDENDYKNIILLLKTKGYIEENEESKLEWIGINGKQSEISALISVLIIQKFLVTKNRSAIARAFLYSIKTDIPYDTIRKLSSDDDLMELIKEIPERSKLL